MDLADFRFEKKLWRRGYTAIGGVDEVGRGSFAGPVVAGCVIFSKKILKRGKLEVLINDSKQLQPKQRELADIWIRQNALAYGIGEAGVGVINKLGIKKATEMAFRRAVSNANSKGTDVEFLLIDAFYAPYVKGLRRKNQQAIIKGDTKSVSIAAASIIAKVYRDKLMTKFSKEAKYKNYGWGRNKGYGTKEHQAAIKKFGITNLHRKDFIKSLLT